MSGLFVNTVQFRFPMDAPRPSWFEIGGFVKQLDSDVLEMDTTYRISDNKCVYIKFKSLEAMQETLRRNTDTPKFQYENGKSVDVRMSIAGSNVRYVRVFDLPPEISDNDLTLELAKYGTVERTIREKFPVESGLGHMYTGVRGVYIDIEEEIPPMLDFLNRKAKVFYDGLKNKCFLCQSEGHRRDTCPSRKTRNRHEKRKHEKGQTNTYAVVAAKGAESSETEIIEEEVIEILEEEISDKSSDMKTVEQENMEIAHKNHMDQVCFEKYGITDYTEKLAELSVAVQEHVRKQQSTNLRKVQLTKTGSSEHSPPKKSSRKSSR